MCPRVRRSCSKKKCHETEATRDVFSSRQRLLDSENKSPTFITKRKKDATISGHNLASVALKRKSHDRIRFRHNKDFPRHGKGTSLFHFGGNVSWRKKKREKAPHFFFCGTFSKLSRRLSADQNHRPILHGHQIGHSLRNRKHVA